MNIFIAGASGFVGGNFIEALLKEGHKLRCLARSEAAQRTIKEKGIDVVPGDITLPETLRGALKDIDFVIHLVGIIEEKGPVTFKQVHVEGTKNLVAEAKKAGVKHFFYQSALGADKGSWSRYLSTKAEAEELVKLSGLPYTIFRPSLIVGPADGFTTKLKELISKYPVIPVPGNGESKFQPVYIQDLIRCLLMVIAAPHLFQGVFEIGGPQQLTYNEIVKTLSDIMKIKKAVIHIPLAIMKLGAFVSEKTIRFLPVTSDQLRLLEADNICNTDVLEKNFGFKPIRYEDAIAKFINA